jgi:pimeloyl-ACP methyl ester carboxylesterase
MESLGVDDGPPDLRARNILLGIQLLGRAKARRGQSRHPKVAAMNVGTLRVDGREVRWLQAGDPQAARTLVLLHAFPFGAGMWELQFDAIVPTRASSVSASWRVLAPSMPGFDGSGRSDQPSVDAFARHVLMWLDRLDVPSAVVAGLSMGGYVAFGLLRQAPERIEGLILADTRSGPDSPEAKPARQRMIDLALHGGPEAVADDFIPKVVGATTLASRPEVVATARRLIVTQSRESIADAVGVLMTRPDSGPLLSSIRVPTCIIVGEEDGLTPPIESERMHAAIAGSTLVRLPGAGHMTNLETPAAFNAALASFLNEFERAR